MSAQAGGDFWRGLETNPRVWLGVVIAVLAIAFILQNRAPAQVDLLSFTFTAPQWTTLTIMFVAGMATGFLLRRKRN